MLSYVPGAAGGFTISFGLTTNQIIRPIIPVRITITSQSAPLFPLFSASLYTHMAINMKIIHIIMGTMHNVPAKATPAIFPFISFTSIYKMNLFVFKCSG